MRFTQHCSIVTLALCAAFTGCSGSSASDTTGSTSSTSSTSSTNSTGSTNPTGSTSGTGGTTDCSTAGGTSLALTVCAANNLLATLTDAQKKTVNLAFTDTKSRTSWSNLPTGMVARAGAKMEDLSTASQAAAIALMNTVLSAAGQSDLNGVRAADSYLGTMQQGYGAGLYYIAIFGTPSTTGDWAIAFGGHHMAYNITYAAGVPYVTPNHLGVEPKAEFTLDGATYAPLIDEGAALIAMFNSLSTTDLASAYLAGQTFMDVLIGPVEYQTGSLSAVTAKYPTGSNRTGVLVSKLTADQQALVTAAINAWVKDFIGDISDKIVADYTSAAAYGDTYIAFGGPNATSVDVDTSGTYMRIDGPRVWIEVACQGGIVIKGKTHYHTIYRDKQFDYSGKL